MTQRTEELKAKRYERKNRNFRSVSIPNESYEKLDIIRKTLPFKASIPQTIEYITKLGLQQLQKERISLGVNVNEHLTREQG